MRYAGFWVRFWAMLIDFALFAPVICLRMSIEGQSIITGCLAFVGLSAFIHGYFIIMHWRFGQTLGKKAMRLKVVRVDGTPIGLREAVLRDIVLLGFSTVSVASVLFVLATWDAPAWASLDFRERWQLLTDRNPTQPWAHYATNLWFVAEIVVLLANRERRAIHDFIGGTVVVRAADEVKPMRPDEVPELAKRKPIC